MKDQKEFTVTADSLIFEGKRLDHANLKFVCGEKQKEIETRTGTIKLNGKRYYGNLTLTPSRDFLTKSAEKNSAPQIKTCDAILTTRLERYLNAVVSSEFSPNWDEKAIDAQVIAARTYAIYQRNEARLKNLAYDLDSSVLDQVFEGSDKEHSRAEASINRTRGRVLSVNGKVIKAFYHSTCGGVTEIPERVWGSAFSGFTHSVKCGFCESSPRFQWSREFLEKDLITKLSLTNARAILGIETIPFATTRRQSHTNFTRAKKTRVHYLDFQNQKQTKELSAQSFREQVGFSTLPSVAFSVSRTTNGLGFKIKGSGNGHGVGLCQWGAKTMGEKGYTHAQILKKYYPLAEISRVY